jgi:hypothetical protein
VSLRLLLSDRDLPPWLRRVVLCRLFRATAAAFRCAPPTLAGLAAQDALARYASFTAQHVQAAMRDGEDLPALQARLYGQAYALGRWCGRVMRVRTMGGTMAMGRFLYRVLEIDFHGDERGWVVVESCFFSQWYSADVCRIMSAMDHGILAGLLGGGELSFQARITEGARCCQARFSAPDGGRGT